MIRSAIVGCGGIAQVHAKSIGALEGARLAACADIVPGKAQVLADAFGCCAYSSLEEMLQNEKIDVLHICTPHPLHTPMAIAAKLCGIHVLTEKPPVATLDQWRQFSALKTGPGLVGICFQNRYNSAVRYMKGLLENGDTGKVLGARASVCWNRKAPYYTESSWRGRWDTEGGGELINQSIHTLDLLVWLLGKPTLAECHMSNHTLRDVIDVEDTVEAFIRFGDANVLFYATNAYCMDAPVFLEIVCERVTMRMEGGDLACLWQDGHEEKPVFFETEPLGKGYWGNGHLFCIMDFYDAVLKNRSYQNNIGSVEDTMLLMLGMYEKFRGIKVP